MDGKTPAVGIAPGAQPLVSVIIPAYNAGRYVVQTIDSALAQTYLNIEIIVIDDGSTDNTREILGSYIADKKIRYHFQENRGLSGARNVGIRMAQGEFIALLDADDIFLPHKIERQVAYLLLHPDCSFSYCDVFHFYDDQPDKMFILRQAYYSGDDAFQALLKRNFINPLSVVMRRTVFDTVGYFDEGMRQFAEDWDFWLRIAHAGLRMVHLPEALAKYRMRKSSLSYNRSLEVTRKRTVLKIFERLNADMSPVERSRYGMKSILRRHRMRLWYAELAERIPFFTWLHQNIQRRRLL